MRARFLAVAGVSAVALIGASAFAPGANAASSGNGAAKGVPMVASATHHGTVTGSATPMKKKKGKCGTKFGTELPTPDGLIAWNDTSGTGFNTAGAANIFCKAGTTIKKVEVYGYYGQATESFNVNIYANDPTDGTNEPADNSVVCSYTGLTGAAGGQYPTHALTTLTLSPACSLGSAKGGTEYWVAVQNNDSAGPWYWEMQNEQQKATDKPDWSDVNDVFGSGCTTWSNDRYLVDCLGYTYGDFMLLLK